MPTLPLAGDRVNAIHRRAALLDGKYNRKWREDQETEAKVEILRQSLFQIPQIPEYRAKQIRAEMRSVRLSAARKRGTHSKDQWLTLIEEFDGRCVICGCYPDPRPCKDHIVPLYLGGSDGADNIQPVCRQCNTAKSFDCTDWASYRRDHGFGDCNAE